MSIVDKWLQEVVYVKGGVISAPNVWSETSVSGSGSRGAVTVSSSSQTKTAFTIERGNGKEFLVEWPGPLGVREGHDIGLAVFRGKTIAVVVPKTDTYQHLTNLEGVVKWWSEAKAFPTATSYTLLLLAIFLSLFTFGLSLFLWLAIAGSKKKKLYKNLGGLGAKALAELERRCTDFD